jgi:hypothetical protein
MSIFKKLFKKLLPDPNRIDFLEHTFKEGMAFLEIKYNLEYNLKTGKMKLGLSSRTDGTTDFTDREVYLIQKLFAQCIIRNRQEDVGAMRLKVEKCGDEDKEERVLH